MTKYERILVPMDRCPYCGETATEANEKYPDMCIDCGKRYHRYASYKSMQRKHYTLKRAKLIEKIQLEYIDLKIAGYKTPKDIGFQLR